MYINNQSELQDFIDRVRQSDVLALDTEFLREKTYFPQLCLLQMATDEENVVVDPFTVGSLDCIKPLFEDPGITKLFHAGTQDIEILYHELNVMPLPVFDTQLAAALLGHSLQVGYGSLVQSECGITLKKGDSFTDWSKRPLSQSQLAYAADDVIYLPKMYRSMKAKLEEQGRLSWLSEDFANLVNPQHYEIKPRDRYKKLRRINQLTRKQLSAAREIAAWREHTAIARNIPRKWVIADEQIVEACKRGAMSIDQLFMIRGISEKLSTSDAREVCNAYCAGIAKPESEWPKQENSNRNEINVDIEVDALSAITRLRAKEHNIAFQALANNSDLAEVARGYQTSKVLQGWRRDIVGQDLLAFMHGEIEISIKDGQLKVTERQ